MKPGVSRFAVPPTAMLANGVVLPGPDCVSAPPIRYDGKYWLSHTPYCPSAIGWPSISTCVSYGCTPPMMIVVSGWLPMCWMVTSGSRCSTSLICGFARLANASPPTKLDVAVPTLIAAPLPRLTVETRPIVCSDVRLA